MRDGETAGKGDAPLRAMLDGVFLQPAGDARRTIILAMPRAASCTI